MLQIGKQVSPGPRWIGSVCVTHHYAAQNARSNTAPRVKVSLFSQTGSSQVHIPSGELWAFSATRGNSTCSSYSTQEHYSQLRCVSCTLSCTPKGFKVRLGIITHLRSPCYNVGHLRSRYYNEEKRRENIRHLPSQYYSVEEVSESTVL